MSKRLAGRSWFMADIYLESTVVNGGFGPCPTLYPLNGTKPKDSSNVVKIVPEETLCNFQGTDREHRDRFNSKL